jgi:hypothetical protein
MPKRVRYSATFPKREDSAILVRYLSISAMMNQDQCRETLLPR